MALGLMNTNRGLFIMEGIFVLFGANKSMGANNAKLKAQRTQGLSVLTKVTSLVHITRSYTILDQISASES